MSRHNIACAHAHIASSRRVRSSRHAPVTAFIAQRRDAASPSGLCLCDMHMLKHFTHDGHVNDIASFTHRLLISFCQLLAAFYFMPPPAICYAMPVVLRDAHI